MLPVQLTYGNEGFKEIKDFLKKNYHEDYTLSIYNNLEQSTIEVICDFDSMMDVILYVTNVEHDFPAWIGVYGLQPRMYEQTASPTNRRCTLPSASR